MKKKSWQRIKRRILHKSKFLTVYDDKVRLPDGGILDHYTLTKKPDVVVIVATTRKNELLVLDEYKYAADMFLRTLPAGHIDKHENPLVAARRELREETGYTSPKLQYLGYLYEYPTKDLHKVHVVRAINATPKSKTSHEKTETIVASLLSVKNLKKEIKNGKWKTSSTLGALVLADLLY